MTNAEKYEEVFGMPADTSNCPTSNCTECPCCHTSEDGCIFCVGEDIYNWWNDDYVSKETPAEWVPEYTKECNSLLGYFCSACHKPCAEINEYPFASEYCPNCGKKMKAGNNNDV